MTRTTDWASLLLGLYALTVPLFTADSADGVTVWVAEVTGGVVVLGALWALVRSESVAAECVQATAGLLLLAAPFIFSYHHQFVAAACHAHVIGTAVTALALSAVPAAWRAVHGRTEGEWSEGWVNWSEGWVNGRSAGPAGRHEGSAPSCGRAAAGTWARRASGSDAASRAGPP